jgi:hypothetical protein
MEAICAMLSTSQLIGVVRDILSSFIFLS